MQAPTSRPASLSRPALFLIAALSLASPALAETELGMQIIGDEDGAFGLLIARWMESSEARLFAPAFIDEELEHLDPWTLKTQIQARQAILPPASPPVAP